ncbi:hypothetical protein LR021_00445 [Candidatus Bipolaricaulota bacterium]|nr:hypothetical protein [Candidatus Bipolaricaulota bacterium]
MACQAAVRRPDRGILGELDISADPVPPSLSAGERADSTRATGDGQRSHFPEPKMAAQNLGMAAQNLGMAAQNLGMAA